MASSVSANRATTKRKAPPHAFKPGQSGNPSGRPKSNPVLTELARAHTAMGIRVLAEIALDKKQPGATRVAAVNALHDRGHGKPTQVQEMTISEDLTQVLERLRKMRGGDK